MYWNILRLSSPETRAQHGSWVTALKNHEILKRGLGEFNLLKEVLKDAIINPTKSGGSYPWNPWVVALKNHEILKRGLGELNFLKKY